MSSEMVSWRSMNRRRIEAARLLRRDAFSLPPGSSGIRPGEPQGMREEAVGRGSYRRVMIEVHRFVAEIGQTMAQTFARFPRG